ncbi:helix-turn-helix transcriptional regulator [Actinomadura sp. DC4]|uniref:helix-turn-helix domain-containing protein n=1 Tax=Actinomadura sp. DC4 TaxID=3055069 RepID=UPI0025AF1674|nr:helix-turn-helix transcriptional regulator [Actinomadura sp. DC4]MDN3359524.1 helix-turn-helix transcriptional regulator [Actinomadura sp. DC4]
MQPDPGDFTRDPLVRAFAALLRAYREAAELSRTQLAEALGCTAQWIAIVENAEKPPSEAFAYDLDTFFKPPVETFHRMWEEIKRAGRHRVLPPGFEAYLQLEAEATSIREYEALLVTGLLQTTPYAQDVLKSGQKVDALDQLVASRMDRQAILERDDPPRLWLLTDETVIRRKIGDPAVRRDQLRRLLLAAQQPHVTVQVVRDDVGSYPGLEGSFMVLSFKNAPDVAYIEGSGGHGILIQKPSEVEEMVVRFDLIRAAALPEIESLKLIAAVMEST